MIDQEKVNQIIDIGLKNQELEKKNYFLKSKWM